MDLQNEQGVFIVHSDSTDSVSLLPLSSLAGRHGSDDVGISRVGDGHGAHSEVFTTGGTELNVVTSVMVNTSLGQHGIVFNLRLPVN